VAHLGHGRRSQDYRLRICRDPVVVQRHSAYRRW